MPDPDLLIRTSGEMRLSNYLLWQVAYTEIYVTERFGPTSAASICWRPSRTSSAESAATEDWASARARWKKKPSASNSPPAKEGREVSSPTIWVACGIFCCAHLQNRCVEIRDELNPWNIQLEELLVAGEEQVNPGGRGTRQVNRVGNSQLLFGA